MIVVHFGKDENVILSKATYNLHTAAYLQFLVENKNIK